jgi:ERCC4-type nuclease
MTPCFCNECGERFESLRSFHCHLKAHSLRIGDYYVKHWAKKDPLAEELIPFKSYEQYSKQDFICYENLKQWLLKVDKRLAKEYTIERAKKKFNEKRVRVSPPNSFYILSEMADINECKRLFGTYKDFLDEIGLEAWFCRPVTKDFWDIDVEDRVQILIDTREQKPLNFKNKLESKLDFGDYTAGGNLYSKTFVDRKSSEDFKQTFGMGADRFRREMDRCVQFNSFMFVVVESSIEKIEEENLSSCHKSKLGFVWHNVREIMLEYPKNIQFIFAQSRAGAKKIIPKILFFGESLWNVDLQFFIDQRIYEGKERVTKLSN